MKYSQVFKRKVQSVFEIVRRNVHAGQVYLHRSHVENINIIFPVINQSFKGNFIGLDFSENISEKPKWEVQSAHFPGIQYSLHCSILVPGSKNYVYHMCDDTSHEPSFVQSVLEDIFEKRGINYG